MATTTSPPKRKGIFWINTYPTKVYEFNDDNAEGFYNTLTGVQHLVRSESNAKDKFLEQRDVGTPIDGEDVIYAESVDILYFCGHGNKDALAFATMDDNAYARRDEIQLGEGGRIKWLVADACQVMQSPNMKKWRLCFRGLHHILGFHSDCGSVTHRGTLFATYLDTLDASGTASAFTVEQAWKRACEEAEPALLRSWAFLRAVVTSADPGVPSTDAENDRWIGHVSPNPTVPTGFVYMRRDIVNPTTLPGVLPLPT